LYSSFTKRSRCLFTSEVNPSYNKDKYFYKQSVIIKASTYFIEFTFQGKVFANIHLSCRS
jgi:hypothetical protein